MMKKNIIKRKLNGNGITDILLANIRRNQAETKTEGIAWENH